MDAAGIPVFGIEALLPGQPSQTMGRAGWHQVLVNLHGVMFQKEALLNAVLKFVPPQFDRIAWVDADVWFTNPHWFDITNSLLGTAAVVQPFSHAIWTGKDGQDQYSLPGAAKAASSDPLVGHPGFAMAARRSLFDTGAGLFDGSITGQGDIHFFAAVSGNKLRHNDLRGLGANHVPYYRWRDAVRRWMASEGGVIAAAPGTVVHEWHGDRTTRNYVGRHNSIEATFDYDRHLKRTPDGWTQWTEEAPAAMMAAVAAYFSERKEDG